MSILESVAMTVLGVFLIAWPMAVVKVIAYVVGAFLVIKGGYRVVNYFIVQGRNDFFNNDLLFGVISVLIGVAVLVMGEEISNIFRIVTGMWTIYEAMVRMITSIKLNSAKVAIWKWVLVISLVMLLLGVVVTFYEGAVVVLIGWILVTSGIAGIFADVMLMQHIEQVTKRAKELFE